MAGRKIRRKKIKSKKKLKVKKISKIRKKKDFNFNKGLNKSFRNPLLVSKNGENVCMICGGETYDVHCKRICKNCGYMRDCSDP